MNKITKAIAWCFINKKVKGGDKMFQILLCVLSFLVKNMALIVGILEAIVKAVTGIISLTPTKQDDKLLPKIDTLFSTIKRGLYNVSNFMAGKEKYIEK